MKQVSPDVTLKQVRQDPESSSGKTVIWGGMIEQVETGEDDTKLQVLHLPLGFRHMPMDVFVSSQGSFLALSTSPLDPAIYEKGRFVTIVGEVKAGLAAALGESPEKYPLLLVQAIHPWPGRGKARLYDREHYWQFYVGDGNGGM
jgi:outer membrane lipoprotein